MALELMLLSVNLNFIIFSVYLDDIQGQIFVLFILTIAATESSIGLALLIVFFKLKNSIHLEKIRNAKK
jgi:NADH-quinone oxidoreductase subunit K